ncbi:MAG: phosphotriesterase family protein [Opitutaceae bacterium]
MSFVRTVLGDIPPAQLGVCYAHEHVVIDRSFTTHANPDFLLDDDERGARELKEFSASGGRAMIDSMPCDCGRNVLKLAALSRRTGVHLICPTGLHLSKYYDPGHWGNVYTEAELAALFIAEIDEGIDAHDYNGPLVRRTAHRAGVIKIATDRVLTPREEKVFAAAGRAHRETGCPILTHTEQGELALTQIELLARHGVDLRHVCLSHTDRKPDVGYHREVLSSGVRVEFDSAFRWKSPGENRTLGLLLALLPEFPHQIMLGMDAARRGYWRSYGGAPGLAFLLDDFCPRLRAAGVSADALHQIFVSTPAATFAFRS